MFGILDLYHIKDYSLKTNTTYNTPRSCHQFHCIRMDQHAFLLLARFILVMLLDCSFEILKPYHLVYRKSTSYSKQGQIHLLLY